MDSDAALGLVCAELAGVKLRLRGVYVRWCVSGPTLEASSALAAMAQDEAGHARILTRLAGSQHPVSDLEQLTQVEAVTGWPELVGILGPVELASVALLRQLGSADNAAYARNITKIIAEEHYHAQFFVGWYTELERNHNAAGAIFARCRQSNEQRATRWTDALGEILAEAGTQVYRQQQDAENLRLASSGDMVCIHCGATKVEHTSSLGGSQIISLMRCNTCGSRFEAIHRKRTIP